MTAYIFPALTVASALGQASGSPLYAIVVTVFAFGLLHFSLRRVCYTCHTEWYGDGEPHICNGA